MKNGDLILMTGVTGTVGQELLLHFIRTTDLEIAPIVRGRNGVSAVDRVRQIVVSAGIAPTLAEKRIHVIEGDITCPEMGLSARIGLLRKRVNRFYHLAAYTELRGDSADHFSINVEGTREALRLARLLPKLDRFVYFSTAFVAGTRYDTEAFEDELPSRSGLANPYEASKHAAEQIVRQAMEQEELPATIFRPSIVVGDEEEGRISSFRVIYPFVQLFIQGALTTLPACPQAVLDIVPLSFVVNAATQIAELSDSRGKTFHLVSRTPPTVRLFLELLQKLVPTAKEVTLIEPEVFRLEHLPSQEQVVFKSIRPYLSYLNRHIRFHTTNTERALSRLGLAFPMTDEEFLTKIFRFQGSETVQTGGHVDQGS